MYYIDIENLVNFTPVSNDFIDRYAGNTESTYIVVYLYIARRALKGRLPSSAELADRFGLSREIIEKIIAYWDSEGLFDKPSKPSYSPSDIARLSEYDSEISGLISTASAILGRALGQKEQSAILSLYDYYRLPIEVITILLGHCSETNHTSINYIEKLGLDWSERGIKTVDEAESYLKLYYGDFSRVMKSFGITGRIATAKEKKYMEKWLTEYRQSVELVCEACEQAVVNTGKISWKYADTALTDWFKNNITTVDAARKYTEEHSVKAKKEKKDKNEKPSKPVRVKSGFSNFEEREYNSAELEELAIELLKEQNDDA